MSNADSLLPARAKHEMVDDKLAAAVKQFRQRLFAARPVENVVLVHLDPGKISQLLVQFIAQSGEFLLLHE